MILYLFGAGAAAVFLVDIAQFINLMVYTNMYMPMNLELFLKSLSIYNVKKFLPNIGLSDQKIFSLV